MEPGVGLRGMGVDVRPSAAAGAQFIRQALGAPGVVVHVLDERVLDGYAPPGGAEVVVGGVEELAHLPLGVDGDELVRNSSSGACRDTASVTGMPSVASLRIRGTRPTVETVIARADSPKPSGEGSVSRCRAATTFL